jgi:hypothetical protein
MHGQKNIKLYNLYIDATVVLAAYVRTYRASSIKYFNKSGDLFGCVILNYLMMLLCQ